MLIGIVSDAHGNLFGLQDAVRKLRQLDCERVFFMGDAISYFPNSYEVLEYLSSSDLTCIKGNHEQMLLDNIKLSSDQINIFNWERTVSSIPEGYLTFLSSWQDYYILEHCNKKVFMVHGGPSDYLNEYVHPNTDKELMVCLPYDIIITAHTHIPFIERINNKLIVNAGSVGFRRDDGSLLSCAIVDTESVSAEIVSFNFPYQHLPELTPYSSALEEVLNRRLNQSEVPFGR